jgi:hypothetical protein
MPRLKRASKKAKQKRVHEEMSKFKRGTLRSSSGKKVTDRKQAIAISLSEAGLSRKQGKGKRKRSRKHGKKKSVLKR